MERKGYFYTKLCSKTLQLHIKWSILLLRLRGTLDFTDFLQNKSNSSSNSWDQKYLYHRPQKLQSKTKINSIHLKSDTKGTEVTRARLNQELKMQARPAKIMRATAKKRQIIMPAKVRYPGPMISRAKISKMLKILSQSMYIAI